MSFALGCSPFSPSACVASVPLEDFFSSLTGHPAPLWTFSFLLAHALFPRRFLRSLQVVRRRTQWNTGMIVVLCLTHSCWDYKSHRNIFQEGRIKGYNSQKEKTDSWGSLTSMWMSVTIPLLALKILSKLVCTFHYFIIDLCYTYWRVQGEVRAVTSYWSGLLHDGNMFLFCHFHSKLFYLLSRFKKK